MGVDAAPECAFRSDRHRLGERLERGNAKSVEMLLPGRTIGEALVVVLGELPDHRTGERPAAHISERLGVDRVVAMAGAQQFEKVEPALRAGRAEPGKAVVANMRAEPVPRLVARPRAAYRDPAAPAPTP